MSAADPFSVDGRELVKEPDVRAAFARSPLVELSAFAALHFLELLVGPKAAGLHVKDADKLGALAEAHGG